jgi:hypothetical protein
MGALSQPATPRFLHNSTRVLCALLILAVMLIAILSRPPKWLSDFDQSFYLTIAYDITHHGTFSNGIFDDVNSTVDAPPPGMFFAPVYPWLMVLASKLDPRFARALDCSVEANHKMRDFTQCEVYARPVHIMHALFLTAGVLAIGFAAELIFAGSAVFWPAAALATLALLPEANLFSFAMTESLTFSLYSIAAWLLIRSLRQPRLLSFLFMGLTFGLLCLTRVSFAVLAPVALGIVAADGLITRRSPRRITAAVSMFALGWALVVGPWVIRNFISVGKLGLTEEYGSATLVERLAFDDMHLDEFLLAFPYCLPGIGQAAIEWALGPQAMQRFDYQNPNSFFRAGRLHREQLVAAHGRVDPIIGKLVIDEMRQRGWKYFLSIIPLAWCGMWVGGMLGLVLVPLFAIACVRSRGEARLLLVFYSAPALVMLALHAAMANHYTRYNLILIGPFSAGAAWIMANWGRRFAASLAPSLSPTSRGSPRRLPR